MHNSLITIVISIILFITQSVYAEQNGIYTIPNTLGFFSPSQKSEFSIAYTISNGELQKMELSNAVPNLLVYIKANQNGSISIEIQKDFMNPINDKCEIMEFIVLNNNYWNKNVKEVKTLSGSILHIPFDKETTEIEIVPDYVPETPGYWQKCINQILFQKILTPIKQISGGVKPSEVFCKEGLGLIFKSTNGNPVCVKPSTAEKLVDRGWTYSQDKADTQIIQKLKEAQNILTNLMVSKELDIPVTLVYVDEKNSVLVIGVNGPLPKDVYLKRIIEIIGDLPIDLKNATVYRD